MPVLAPILNKAQLAAFDAIENGCGNILVLGQAGTGKSTFINYLKSASKKRIICACPTAVSAINIGGQTIHSLFQIQPRDFIMPEFLKLKAKPRNILFGSDLLVIDEISMVAPDLLDAIDILARQARKNNAPFGGLQVVAIGDLFQLPPVITRDAQQYYQQAYEHPNAYFFDSNVYKRANFQKANFDLVYRQSDSTLLDGLVRLRCNETSALDFFNSCKIEDESRRSNAVIITPFRAVAERINADRLARIAAPATNYAGELKGNFSEKDAPAPLNLTLKVGALVVFVKNGDKWHNGSIGIVRELGAHEIKVRLLGGDRETVSVKPEKWDKVEYVFDENGKPVENEAGSYRQFPLNLGYAMTIHKAQGKTLDAVVVDISRGAFAHGQTYVALSRTRRSADIHVAAPLRPRDVIFDQRVLDFVG
ncbi:MAG: AAA family ATPase [Rickettsiales bacterium]|jgi:ATP-dependent exoDNAse (exonuclease V) alpha subunit|nr:AAA family ATPase [Rickettsiales bacterium]